MCAEFAPTDTAGTALITGSKTSPGILRHQITQCKHKESYFNLNFLTLHFEQFPKHFHSLSCKWLKSQSNRQQHKVTQIIYKVWASCGVTTID